MAWTRLSTQRVVSIKKVPKRPSPLSSGRSVWGSRGHSRGNGERMGTRGASQGPGSEHQPRSPGGGFQGRGVRGQLRGRAARPSCSARLGTRTMHGRLCSPLGLVRTDRQQRPGPKVAAEATGTRSGSQGGGAGQGPVLLTSDQGCVGTCGLQRGGAAASIALPSPGSGRPHWDWEGDHLLIL